jgi:hypothetical protein
VENMDIVFWVPICDFSTIYAACALIRPFSGKNSA